MMRKLAIVLVATLLAACVAVGSDPTPAPARAQGPAKSQGHGPPPHAPAHGYRSKTPQGVDVVFDTQIGVYVVVSVPGRYWLADRYYRKGDSGWVVSASVAGPWASCPADDLPKGLQAGATKKNGKPKPSKANNQSQGNNPN